MFFVEKHIIIVTYFRIYEKYSTEKSLGKYHSIKTGFDISLYFAFVFCLECGAFLDKNGGHGEK